MRKIPLTLAFLFAVGSCGLADDYTIAIVPKGTTHEFWKAVHAGAVKATRELEKTGTHIELLWKGPLKENDREGQIQVVENFVGRHVSGIVLAPLDARALAAPVEAAANAEIPVVVIDSALESNLILSFVATDNHAGGKLAAEHLGKLIGGEGAILMLRYLEGSASTEERERGFMEGMTALYPEIKVLSSDQHSGPTRETAYAASQNLVNRFGQDIQGVFTPNESSTVGMNLALREAGLTGAKVKHVGFDASQPLIKAMRADEIQGLLVQDPFQMGFLGVKLMAQHLTGKGAVEKKMDTPVEVITPKDLDDPRHKELLEPPLAEYLQ